MNFIKNKFVAFYMKALDMLVNAKAQRKAEPTVMNKIKVKVVLWTTSIIGALFASIPAFIFVAVGAALSFSTVSLCVGFLFLYGICFILVAGWIILAKEQNQQPIFA
jgi:hypothetical protein